MRALACWAWSSAESTAGVNRTLPAWQVCKAAWSAKHSIEVSGAFVEP